MIRNATAAILCPIIVSACLPIVVTLFAPTAKAWDADKENDIPLECKGWQTNIEQRLVVRVSTDNGSFGKPRLVALGENAKILWQRRFPYVTDINTAKAYTGCSLSKNRKSVVIELSDSFPGDPHYIHYRFRFDGNRLKILERAEIA